MKKIAFFITAEKHIKNIALLKEKLYDSENFVITNRYDLLSDKVIHSSEIENISPDLIVMFMAFPNKNILDIQYYGLKNNIPVIGIEEVNQLSLNNSRVNHYFTPLDKLLAVSEVEKKLLIMIFNIYKIICTKNKY